MTMTNKQYKAAREMAEGAEEIYTFEHYNGFSFYTNKYMTSEDLKEMRKDYKAIKAERDQIMAELAEQGMQGDEIEATISIDRDLQQLDTNQ